MPTGDAARGQRAAVGSSVCDDKIFHPKQKAFRRFVRENPSALLLVLKLRTRGRQFGGQNSFPVQAEVGGLGIGTIQGWLFRTQRRRRPDLLEAEDRSVPRRKRDGGGNRQAIEIRPPRNPRKKTARPLRLPGCRECFRVCDRIPNAAPSPRYSGRERG